MSQKKLLLNYLAYESQQFQTERQCDACFIIDWISCGKQNLFIVVSTHLLSAISVALPNGRKGKDEENLENLCVAIMDDLCMCDQNGSFSKEEY